MDATVWVKLYNAVCIHAICCLVQSPDPTQENRPETFPLPFRKKKLRKGLSTYWQRSKRKTNLPSIWFRYNLERNISNHPWSSYLKGLSIQLSEINKTFRHWSATKEQVPWYYVIYAITVQDFKQIVPSAPCACKRYRYLSAKFESTCQFDLEYHCAVYAEIRH